MVQSLMGWVERQQGGIYLAVTLLLVLCSRLSIRGSEAATMLILVLGVVFLGLPHGALDTQVGPRTFGGWRHYSQWLFSLVYVSISALYGLIWWWQPTATLISFLILSAWHFSSDWESTRSWVAKLGYGVTVVSLAAVAHREAVGQIFLALGTRQTGLLLEVMAFLGPMAALVGFLGLWQSGSRSQNYIELSTIVVSALVLPPLLYFVAYFCFLHSPRHLFVTARGLGIERWSDLLRSVGPAVAVSVAGGVAAWVLLPAGASEARLLQVVFIGLAVLTLPHMLLTWVSRAD
jgi:beta-carotene 15,15'-dioxygenase